jgi:hypothetical protein
MADSDATKKLKTTFDRQTIFNIDSFADLILLIAAQSHGKKISDACGQDFCYVD